MVTRWLFAGLLLAMSLWVIVSQIVGIAAATRRLKQDPNARGYSFVPLFGGLLGTFGCLVAPHASVQRCWWVPLILDPFCALLFVAMLFYGVRNVIRRFIIPKN